jgi:hypothetical protein
VTVTNANGTPAVGVVLGNAVTTNDVDYVRTVQLPAGSYVAKVDCNSVIRTSNVATVGGSVAPPPFLPASPLPTPSPVASPPAPLQALRLLAPNQYLIPGREAFLSLTGSPGQAVQLRCYTRPNTGYSSVRFVNLSAAGTADFRLLLPASTRCFARYGTDDSTGSNSVVLQVHYGMTMTVTRTGTNTFAFAGAIKPADIRKAIGVFRLGAGNPFGVATARTDALGRWRVEVTFPPSSSGRTYDFDATTAATLNHASGTSNVVPVHIR